MTSVYFINMPLEYYSAAVGGAISTIIFEVARELEARGHCATIVTRLAGAPPPAGRVIDLGAIPHSNRLSRLLARVPFAARFAADSSGRQYRRDVLRALRSLPEPDALVIFNDYASATWLRARYRHAHILTWLQNDENLPANWEKVRLSLSRVLCCSDYIRGRAVERGVPPTMAVTATSGVDAAAFHPRRDWLTPRQPIRVLCIGRLDPNKGHDAAIAAARRMLDKGFAIELTLAGARWWYGRQLDKYGEALVAEVAAGGGQFLGLVSRGEVPALMRAHDVVFMLSRAQEPLGLVVLEAMASGCAVIASPLGGLPEACGGAAILVSPDDPLAIDETLERLIASESTLTRAKARGRLRAERAPWSLPATVLLAALEGAPTPEH